MAETTVKEFVPDIVESTAYRVISQLLTIPLAYANQNNSRLSLPYATMRVSSRLTMGGDEHGAVDSDGIMPLYGVREGTVMINIYGGQAREHCDNLVNSVKKVTSRYLMRREKFVISDNSQVNDMTGLRDSMNFEPMANVDFNFRYTSKYTDDVGLIEKVSASLDIAGITSEIKIPVSAENK